MLLLHNELMRKVDIFGWTLVNAPSNTRFDDHGGDEILVSGEEEAAGKPLTIVEQLPSNRSKKFHFFYSKGEVKCLPNNFVFSHMTLCTLVMSWFCGNPSIKMLPLKFLC